MNRCKSRMSEHFLNLWTAAVTRAGEPQEPGLGQATICSNFFPKPRTWVRFPILLGRRRKLAHTRCGRLRIPDKSGLLTKQARTDEKPDGRTTGHCGKVF